MKKLKEDIAGLEAEKKQLLFEIETLKESRRILRTTFCNDTDYLKNYGFRNQRHRNELEKQVEQVEEKSKKDAHACFAARKLINTMVEVYEQSLLGLLRVGEALADAKGYKSDHLKDELVGVARALKIFRGLCRPLKAAEVNGDSRSDSYSEKLGLGTMG